MPKIAEKGWFSAVPDLMGCTAPLVLALGRGWGMGWGMDFRARCKNMLLD